MIPLPAIIPQRCYRDAHSATRFLERAFGFSIALIVPGDGDDIAHAELWSGHGCIMLATLPADPRWAYRTPNDIGGANTGSPYVATSDIDTLYARAQAAGCAIVSELAATDYGSRDFSARDPEGFLWSFGTYRPLAAPQTPGRELPEPELFAGMRYVDATAAIAWLGRAFGAEPNLVVPGPDNSVAHAQLTIGEGLFMLGSARDDAFGLATPGQIGGVYTQSLNVWVADPDRHYAVALAAGAEILAPPAGTPYGARGYVARDPEGYVWNFSTYRPAVPAPRPVAAPSVTA